jgi:hypothetical protein
LVYVGSPYQTKADEAGQDKGYVVWNGSRVVHVATPWGERYHNFGPKESISKAEIQALTSKDVVRVSVTNEKEAKKLGAMLAKQGIKHTITVEPQATEARIQPPNESLRSYARAYLEALVPPDLDKATLESLLVEITE